MADHIRTTAAWMIEFHTSKKIDEIKSFLDENLKECYSAYGETPELYVALLQKLGVQSV